MQDFFIESDDRCQLRALFSFSYRLAPESPYPAAIDDVERAFRHFAKHAADYNIDPSRIAAAGDSAGGDLVASLTIRLKKAAAKADAEGELHPQIKVQFLLYPVLQVRALVLTRGLHCLNFIFTLLCRV